MLNQFIVPKEKFLLGMYLGYMKCILKKWDRAVCPRGGLVVGTPPRVGVSDNPLPCRLALRPTLVPLRWGSVTPLRWFPCCGVPSPGLGCPHRCGLPYLGVRALSFCAPTLGCPRWRGLPYLDAHALLSSWGFVYRC